LSKDLPVSALFTPLRLRSIEIPNRVVMSPMCMYSCIDGLPGDWHKVHLGSRADGGVGLVMLEATGVTAVGRITDRDLGLWSEAHARALEPIAALIAQAGSVPGIQIAHAGRKGGRTAPWMGNTPIPEAEWGKLPAPSPIPFQDTWHTPEAMDEAAIAELVVDFATAARRAVAVGFRVVEIHMAHGYLMHQFLSPLANHRNDVYGGDLERRAAVPLKVARAVRAAVPDELPLFVRLSVVDWAAGGITLEDTIQVVRWLRDTGVDLIDCSSGAVVPGETPQVAPGYHAPMSRAIREQAGIRTGVVGLITEPQMAEDLIEDGTADLIILARALLKNPYWTRMAAEQLGAENAIPLPIQYRRAVARMGGRTQW
jgi:2,4-dienoyl-CoA reductase-like NADH-dependent reductase (Old Yellow Enzyme family)